MSLRRKDVTIINGIIVLALTVVLFILAHTKYGMIDWLSLFFIVTAEVVFFGGLLIVDHLAASTFNAMFRSITYIILAAYSFFNVIFSFLFMLILRHQIRMFISVQAIIAASAAVIYFIAYATSISMGTQNQQVLAASVKLKDLSNKIMILFKNENNAEYRKELEKLYEAVMYTDVSSTVATDDIISNKINDLEIALVNHKEEDKVRIIELINNILNLIDKRSAEVKLLKEGGI
jgi:hypothetical protein